jgi:hypothetical protein
METYKLVRVQVTDFPERKTKLLLLAIAMSEVIVKKQVIT